MFNLELNSCLPTDFPIHTDRLRDVPFPSASLPTFAKESPGLLLFFLLALDNCFSNILKYFPRLYSVMPPIWGRTVGLYVCPHMQSLFRQISSAFTSSIRTSQPRAHSEKTTSSQAYTASRPFFPLWPMFINANCSSSLGFSLYDDCSPNTTKSLLFLLDFLRKYDL